MFKHISTFKTTLKSFIEYSTRIYRIFNTVFQKIPNSESGRAAVEIQVTKNDIGGGSIAK